MENKIKLLLLFFIVLYSVEKVARFKSLIFRDLDINYVIFYILNNNGYFF